MTLAKRLAMIGHQQPETEMVTASEMGKKGGSAKSDAKTAAARKNASKPRGKWVTAIAYELDDIAKYKAFGSVITTGKPPTGALACDEWLRSNVRDLGVGLQDAEELVFLNLSSSSMKV